MTTKLSMRTWLAAMWLACFAFVVGTTLYLLISHRAEWGTIGPALNAVSDVYAPYLGLIMAFYFGTRSRVGPTKTSFNSAAVLALVLSVLWNILIVGAALLVVLGYFPIEDSTQRISEIGPKLAWLVTPAIGYFFAKTPSHG
jgi:hypothetical protein